MQIDVQPPDKGSLVTGARLQLELAEAFTIDSDAVYGAAADELKSIKKAASDLESRRLSITRPIDEAKKQIMDLFREPLELLTRAEGLLKGSMLTYQRQKEEERKAEQRRLEELARLERQRLAQEARATEERARAEALRLENEARESQEQAAAEAVRLEEEAHKALTDGDDNRAEDLFNMADSIAATSQAASGELSQRAADTIAQGQRHADAINTTAAVITIPSTLPKAPKVSGVNTSKKWKAEVVDKSSLVAYVAKHPEFLHLLDVNNAAVQAIARAMKENCALPGVRVFEDMALSASRG